MNGRRSKDIQHSFNNMQYFNKITKRFPSGSYKENYLFILETKTDYDEAETEIQKKKNNLLNKHASIKNKITFVWK